MAARFGIDVGGTFTDFIYYDDRSGEIRVHKVPTTPTNPDEGCLAAVTQALEPRQIADAGHFLHGTTVGLNALLERRGPVLALLTTAGFRDLLEIRRGDRKEMFNLWWRPPEPLVPRSLRFELTERVTADGLVHTALDRGSVSRAAELLQHAGVTSVAVCLMNAYVNPDHELAVEALLRELGFEGEVTLSHRISREYREFERTSTTVVDAFVRARMHRYLRRLAGNLKEHGFPGQCLITRSGGGSMAFNEAEARPFETINSGPVAGAEGAAELARELGIPALVTADVGGTSFDTTVISDGQPRLLYEGNVIGFPLQTSWVDVRSIGAGGGSVAYIDAGGLLRVGPRSAGAVPGPACYGRGGIEPTVTDAALTLGMLGTGAFQSGLVLDRAKAHAALGGVASSLGLSVQDTARGIMRIAAASMSNAIREITVEQGEDPRDMALLAFGGGGPLMATLLADDLDMHRIVVPNHAGNFSAWGLLGADIVRSTARTWIKPLSEQALRDVKEMVDELFAEILGRLQTDSRKDSFEREVSLDLRYIGQAHTLAVPFPFDSPEASRTELAGRFAERYRKSYGIELPDEIEVVSVRATLRTRLPRRAIPCNASPTADAGPRQMLAAYSFTGDEELPFALVDRNTLAPGARIAGPAIVNELTTTTYLDAGFTASVLPSGHLMLTREEA